MASSPSLSQKDRYSALDGLRGIAVFGVVAFHLWAVGPVPGLNLLARRLFSFGWSGVDMFFVISGFLITSILIREKQAPHFFRNFFARRALRILPPYFLFCLCVVGVLPLVSTSFQQLLDIQKVSRLPYLFFLTNIYLSFRGTWISMQIDHLWSLAIEEQFYLIWPFVVYACSPRRLNILCPILIVSAFVIRVTLWATGTPSISNVVLPFCKMDTLAMGAWIAVRASQGIPLPRFLVSPWTAGLLLLPLMLSIVFGIEQEHALMRTLGFSILVLGMAALLNLVLLAPAESPLRRVAEYPLLVSLGKYSYFVYLFHTLFGVGAQRLFVSVSLLNSGILGQVFCFSLGFGFCCFFARLSYRFFEKPLLDQKKHFYAPVSETPEILPLTGT